ncbi:DUF58 domain-containing protein [Dactylosporangium matsuzakiense]|uniref:DUF58 domain-containing protein n=1 Tax=Dactylosporangium matsuzakiense TaxID=53360 RepID=A0A9W6KK67_9ACTN|nr:DUF58 domain-containing protein [Dactylosporangium matsuzakiense]UWZ46788.1 DUF58 domain-containing protein [Dactylosporangium matsuzakiense]GLL01761.1 hypothetical protein GCM10017581_035030 [Dactylosporangium matsuzakiense]
MRLTARGAGLGGAAAVLLAAGLIFGYRHLVVLGTACVAALLFAGGYVWFRPRLTVARGVEPDRVMRGESSTVTLEVGNTSRLRGATLIAHDRCGAASVAVPLLRLKAGGSTTAQYPVPTDRRGVVGIGPLRVVRHDPLGLITLARGYGGTAQVWVYPRVHRLTAVPTGITRSLDGRDDRVPHGTITFDTLREYVVGDELRRVHWRTSAKVGELMVREQLDTSLPRLAVLLDDRRSSYPDADLFEAACEAAASLVMAAFRDELPIVLRLLSGRSAADRSARAYLDLLAESELSGPGSSGAGASATSDRSIEELRTQRVGDTLIYLTGDPDLAQVSTLRTAYPTLVAGVFGPARPALERVVVLAVRDGAEFAAAWDGVQVW